MGKKEFAMVTLDLDYEVFIIDVATLNICFNIDLHKSL